MKPLIIQSDHGFLLEVENDQYENCRDFLAKFAELIKSPEFMHTYKTTPLSLWNAASLNYSFEEIEKGILEHSKYQVPQNVIDDLKTWYNQYGKLVLEKYDDYYLVLSSTDDFIFDRIINNKDLGSFWQYKDVTELNKNNHVQLENQKTPLPTPDQQKAEAENIRALVILPEEMKHHLSGKNKVLINNSDRGSIKSCLIKAGYPVKDLCGYVIGDALKVALRDKDTLGKDFQLRDYQKEAINTFYQQGRNTGGSGIIVLPCGAGKTIVGLGVLSTISSHTLIITTNNTSVRQWKNEILQKTTLTEDMVGEYTGNNKEIKPVTITTYQMLTHRKSKYEEMPNLMIFTKRNWGLIIYDEVHTLPAPIFSITTLIQATRRLGMTATLVREDGKETDVFALIGPKKYDVPWKVLENRGFIAEAFCIEFRVKLNIALQKEYAYAAGRSQFRVAAENIEKISLLKKLLIQHCEDQILIIGQYITQLEHIANHFEIPLITGKTSHKKRENIYNDFKNGKIKCLVVSKVANFAVDLPDANILIQMSGSYGSRQEEAQRLGRILRPKKKSSYFYSLISHNTIEQDFSSNRQLFLLEQGYKYEINYF